MVKCERSYPAPESLNREKIKGKNGKYNSEDVINRLMPLEMRYSGAVK